MRKQCQRCGAAIEITDYYASLSTKYCRRCAGDVTRENKAAYMREFRRKQRESNALTRQLCEAQQQEIDRLRELIIRQRARVRELEEELET